MYLHDHLALTIAAAHNADQVREQREKRLLAAALAAEATEPKTTRAHRLVARVALAVR